MGNFLGDNFLGGNFPDTKRSKTLEKVDMQEKGNVFLKWENLLLAYCCSDDARLDAVMNTEIAFIATNNQTNDAAQESLSKKYKFLKNMSVEKPTNTKLANITLTVKY